MAPKRKCVFNDELKEEFPFIRTTATQHDVKCNKCLAIFSIANSGRSAIKQHLQTAKHKEADKLTAKNKPLSSFLRRQAFDDEEKMLAIKEASWSYHLIQHNHSFRSNDCTSKLIQSCFDKKYSCARTKTEAIILNIFAPHSVDLLKKDLSSVNYVTVYADCSNHGNIKLCTILLRYFLPNSGIKVKVLSVKGLPG